MLTNDRFRAAMGALPMAVSVVTTAVGGEPIGATIGSVTSTSMRPPLVSFNVRTTSRLCEALRTAPRFAVNVLEEGQTGLSGRFSGPGDRFEGVPFEWSAGGVPWLRGALLRLECRRAGVYPAGDHVIVLGAVLEAEREADRAPLLYVGRSYRRLGRSAGAS